MSVLPKFLANAQINPNTVAVGVLAMSPVDIVNLFKDDKVADLESIGVLVKKSLDSGDYARVSIKTGRRIG